MGTSSETEETTTAPSSSKIKSLKDAAKSQQHITAQKKEKAKEVDAKEARMNEESLAEVTHMTKEKKKALKLETQQKKMLSKENRIDLSKGSTKNRILENIRKRQKEERDSKSIQPSMDFQQSMRGLYDMGLELVRQDGAPIAGYDRDNKAVIIDSHYAYVSPERVWGGPFKFKEGTEKKQSFLQDVDVFEAIFRSKEAVNGTKPDVKITEIQFKDEKAATEGLPKVKEISKAIWENPKHINQFWQDEERVYLIQTRAASFEDVYERANKVLYFTATSSR
ncbi:MAG: hypothetical protein AB8B69_01455 [Chitinophagales bacterium]